LITHLPQSDRALPLIPPVLTGSRITVIPTPPNISTYSSSQSRVLTNLAHGAISSSTTNTEGIASAIQNLTDCDRSSTVPSTASTMSTNQQEITNVHATTTTTPTQAVPSSAVEHSESELRVPSNIDVSSTPSITSDTNSRQSTAEATVALPATNAPATSHDSALLPTVLSMFQQMMTNQMLMFQQMLSSQRAPAYLTATPNQSLNSGVTGSRE
jgi:hypothetical protein